MFLNTLPMTDSLQLNNKGNLPLHMLPQTKTKNTMATSPDSCFTKDNKTIIIDNLSDLSVRSESTASTYSSSVGSNDDSIQDSESEVVISEFDVAARRKSALKSPNNSLCHRLRQDDVRGIQFHSTVKLRWHLALHEYTIEELDACWFRENEHAEIARSCRKEIKMIERGLFNSRFIDDHDRRYCARGLEAHTHLAAMARNQNRLTARAAVTEEQRDQWSLGVIDDEAIASKYRDASSSPKLWAIRVGQQDQRVAQVLYDLMVQ